MSSGTKRNFIIAALLLLTMGGLFTAGLTIVTGKEAVLKTQLAAIKTGNEREQTYHRLNAIAEESKMDREKLSNYFLPQASESITFLSLVESLAPQSGVTLETDALGEGGDKKTKEKWVEATFTFSGRRQQVEQFVEVLENVPYVSEITALSLSAKTEGDWGAKVTMRVFIQTYEN